MCVVKEWSKGAAGLDAWKPRGYVASLLGKDEHVLLLSALHDIFGVSELTQLR